MADFPNIEPDAEQIGLVANTQIYESPLTRGVQTASLNGSRWMASPTYNNRNGKDARDLRAFIFNQDGTAGRFNYYPFTADNLGTHAGAGVVDGAGQVGKSLLTKGWDADQELLFAAGDYLTINGEMKMVTADVSVGQDYIEYDAVNYMPSPFDPSGWVPDTDGTINNVLIENPSGTGVYGLAEVTVGSSFFLVNRTFNLTVSVGEKVFCAVLAKGISPLSAIRAQMQNQSGAQIYNSYVNSTTGNTFDNGDGPNKIDILPNGDILMQFQYTVESGVTDIDCNIIFFNLDQAGGASGISTPKLGDQQYVQAAFFGKASDWPGKLRANATIPIAPALRVSPSDGNAIEADSPYFPARLESDDQTKLQVSSNLIYSTTLSIVEDF